MESLLGKNIVELQEVALELGLPKYVGEQLAGWLYRSKVVSFEEMSNLPKNSRSLLQERYTTGIQPPVGVQQSADGTKKYLYPAFQGKFIEAAYMPEEKRCTLCISTQVGCKMGCLFCMTGRQGFQGNLTAGEIINQVRSLPERDKLTNLVFMGMGEPFDNTEEVMKSLHILCSEKGLGFPPRKVTVSTIGIIPGIILFLKESKCNMAISLHSPFDEERRSLMPIQHVYPVKEVITAIEQANPDRYRKISFEYILFKGINDTPRHVKELARLLNKIRCRVNLMRYHPLPGSPMQGSDEAAILAFQRGLNEKGIIATIRQSRGLDIDAACGLLSTKALLKDQ
ncbi:MAG: 23S rRNA (adenine(2503)-C(2))-methyltransferase RlmN [Bacteroidetes bacterium]|nr:23S rRNA (adenine(2503)-C(2))-methyltransferase RlmN [Bacteroidota bacterium]